MTQTVAKTIMVDKVYPGPYGGAIVVGMPLGECEVLRCKLSSRIVARLPGKGEFWRVEGSMANSQKHGPQLIAKSCRPTDLPEVSYVSSILAKHPTFRGFAFGPKKLADVLRRFGEERLVKLLNDADIDTLCEAIEAPVATGLVKAWQTLRNENATISFLIDHSFSPVLARKVMYLCQEGTVERLKRNPFALVCFGGITRDIWGAMERCAENLGVSLDFVGRLVGGIEHVLYEHLRLGNTAMGKTELLCGAEKLLGCRKRADEGLRLALEQKAVCVYPQQPEPLFQLAGVGIIEQTLERRIEALLSVPRQMSLFDGYLAHVSCLVDTYDSKTRAAGCPGMNREQKNAVVMALTTTCSVITGYGGTGKTTVLKIVADIAKALQRKTYMLALAGKAKERLRQATGHKSFTIHAFIGAVKKGSEDVSLDGNPLIIVDECSMVDTALFNSLLGLLEGRQYSLLTVGDTEQISPVGFGLVWHRMAKLDMIPRTNLTQVYRQRSSLHALAMKVRSNDKKVLEGVVDTVADWNGETEGVYFVPCDRMTLRDTLVKLKCRVDQILREQLRARIKRTLEGGRQLPNPLMAVALEARMKEADDAGEIPRAVILTPHMSRRKVDSGERINRHLQGCLTPLAESLDLGDGRINVGDPVIVSENAYDLGLFNGTTGALLGVSSRNGKTSGHFRFDGHKAPVWLSVDELLDLGLRVAYAVSVHKSQGSEYDAAIITCIENSPMLERSLLYTALTRSKQLCLVVGSRDVFRRAAMSPSRAETLNVGFFLSRVNRGRMST